MSVKVTIVDYGGGNLWSVRGALEYCGAEPVMSADPKVIESADRLLIPGVGAFGDCMKEMRGQNLVEPALRFVASGRPLLGICVGMQMLLDESEEFGLHPGLGLIPGKVVAIPPTGADGKPHRLPHIGWSEVVEPEAGRWRGTFFEGTKPGSWVYFVHSFTAVPHDAKHRLADCDYNGRRISAAVARDNVVGCQFHPEKSGEAGLSLIGRFLRL
jgi:imidazole glycerol-phosphate synthase subunit HisH